MFNIQAMISHTMFANFTLHKVLKFKISQAFRMRMGIATLEELQVNPPWTIGQSQRARYSRGKESSTLDHLLIVLFYVNVIPIDLCFAFINLLSYCNNKK